ncbi:hypothetical protein BaRGS_00016132 [Batillaria attramentaria]|uniref:Uncharacterized protein n=1 Tax=Batillaria attramentaria TaxID=370345 RepID=A0ABD0KZH7_9CAEN
MPAGHRGHKNSELTRTKEVFHLNFTRSKRNRTRGNPSRSTRGVGAQRRDRKLNEGALRMGTGFGPGCRAWGGGYRGGGRKELKSVISPSASPHAFAGLRKGQFTCPLLAGNPPCCCKRPTRGVDRLGVAPGARGGSCGCHPDRGTIRHVSHRTLLTDEALTASELHVPSGVTMSRHGPGQDACCGHPHETDQSEVPSLCGQRSVIGRASLITIEMETSSRGIRAIPRDISQLIGSGLISKIGGAAVGARSVALEQGSAHQQIPTSNRVVNVNLHLLLSPHNQPVPGPSRLSTSVNIIPRLSSARPLACHPNRENHGTRIEPAKTSTERQLIHNATRRGEMAHGAPLADTRIEGGIGRKTNRLPATHP